MSRTLHRAAELPDRTVGNPALPFFAWFDQLEACFANLTEAKQWIADQLGRDNTTDDYGVQHLEDDAKTVVADHLGADAAPPSPDSFQ